MALQSKRQWTPLHEAAHSGEVDKVRELLKGGKYDVNCVDLAGWTPLHEAVSRGHLGVVKVLALEFKADVNARDNDGNTPLHRAILEGHLGVVRFLLTEFKIDVNDSCNGTSTPMDMAIKTRMCSETVAMALMDEFHCGTKEGTPYICTACEKGWVNLVRALVHKHGTGILNCVVVSVGSETTTPLLHHIVARTRMHHVAEMLASEFDSHVRDQEGRSLLHLASAQDQVGLVRTLLHEGKAGLWVVDSNGDTPLHICARLRQTNSVKVLLEFDPPVLLRNHLGQTPKDVEEKYAEGHRYIEAYMKLNKDKIYFQYRLVEKHAKKKYSRAEPIFRAFVVGHPGAGKSSFVEALKREGFFDSFKRVSESSVPLHTAGIVPSIHSSKHYGRVLFYDFAGDAEYYSSHAAILESLASSRKGENVFLLVIDMREEMSEIKKIFHYWLLFIQYQQFHGQKPRLIVVGSHLDMLRELRLGQG